MPATDPSTISGYLAAHLMDADAISGTDGVAVGTHNGYAAPVGYTAPIYKADAVNGHASLVFASDGVNKTTAYAKELADAPGSPNLSQGAFPVELTVVAVVKPTALSDIPPQFFNRDRRAVVGLNRAGEVSGTLGLRKSDGSYSQLTLSHDGNGSFWNVPGRLATYPEGEWCVVGFRTDSVAVKSWKGFSQDKLGDNPLGPEYGQEVTAFSLGTDLAIDGRAFDGEIAYFAAFDRALTDEEYEGAAEWLLTRFALPLRDVAVDAFVGTTGKDVFVSFESSQTGDGAYLTAVTTGGVGYSVNGGAVQYPTPVWRQFGLNGEYSGNMLALPASTPVASGDVVTAVIAPGAITTTLGTCEEFEGTAENFAGQATMLSQTAPAGRTMKVGYNFNTDGNYFQPVSAYRNLFKKAHISNASGLTVADDGTVTDAPSGVTWLIRAGADVPWPPHPGAEFGRYLLQWAGPAGSSLTPVATAFGEGTVITYVSGPTLVGGVWKSLYDITRAVGDAEEAALFSVQQSAHAPLTDVWIGLESDYSTTEFFSPLVVSKLANVSSVRFMDAMQTNFSNLGRIDELDQASYARYGTSRRRFVGVSRFEGYDGPYFWPTTNRQHWKITTTEPHGLSSGQFCVFPNVPGTFAATLADRGAVDGVTEVGGCSNVVVLSPTEFAFAEYNAAWGQRATVTPWTTPGAEIQIDTYCGMPAEMMAALCNEAGAEFCHVTFPHPLPDAAITHLAERIVATLGPTVKLRAECSNEVWNGAFGQQGHFSQQTVLQGGASDAENYRPAYFKRSFEVLDLCRAAFVAAARSAEDVGLVINVQDVNGAAAVPVAEWVNANGKAAVQGVWLQTAPYSPAHPLGRLPGVDYSAWTLARMLDHHEAYVRAYDQGENGYLHRAALDAGGLSHWKLGTYECQNGFLGFTPGNPDTPQNFVNFEAMDRENIALAFHPRMYGVTLARFAMLQAAGFEVNTIYNLFHGHGYEFVRQSVSNYGDYAGLTCLAGRGDGSSAGRDARPYITGVSGLPVIPATFNLESVRGLAALDWAVPEAAPTTVTGGWGAVASPRFAAVESVGLTFSESVVGVSLGGITLTLDGSPVALTAVLSGSGSTRTLSLLSGETAAVGDYVLTLAATGVTSADTVRPLAGAVTRSWTMSDPSVTHRVYAGRSRWGRF